MVKAIMDIPERENRILNTIKGQYGFKNRNQAFNFVIKRYEQTSLEPELRPEYIEKAKKIMKQSSVKVGTVNNLRKRLSV